MASQVKDTPTVRQNVPKNQENSNPNLTSPPFKSSPSSSLRGSKQIHKSASKNPTFVSPKKKIRERKFVVVAKKNNPKKQDSDSGVNCKCKEKINGKCLCVAYENLRVSQEEFFKSRDGSISVVTEEHSEVSDGGRNRDKESNSRENEVWEVSDEKGICEPEEGESPKGLGLGLGSSTMKRRRDLLLEEARASVPESGKVMHLVKAFERLLTLPKKNEHKDEENEKKGIRWALPGLQQPPRAPETETETHESSSGFCPGEYFFTAESLGFDAHVSSSLDSSRGSVSSRSSIGSRRSRRSGSFSSETVGGRKWKLKQKQQHRVTSLRPFKLRTEQRGKAKEEEFVKKLQEMMAEEEKQRIPLAQGLPWTTDEPECLVKPPVKEVTRPIDLKLHSDVRAVERADFDCQRSSVLRITSQKLGTLLMCCRYFSSFIGTDAGVQKIRHKGDFFSLIRLHAKVAEKMTLIEQYKMERERQQKLEEEEEIRRLRKELVPKAQPMPYFDRPFIPRRSVRQPTVPKEPKFHCPQQKKIKCCLSLDDLGDYINAT